MGDIETAYALFYSSGGMLASGLREDETYCENESNENTDVEKMNDNSEVENEKKAHSSVENIKRSRSDSHSSIADILVKKAAAKAKQHFHSSKNKSDSKSESTAKKLKTDSGNPENNITVGVDEPPIFIISILPHTSLPAHSFQKLLPPLSPHHYPPMSARWPVLTPPLSLYAKNVYVKKYSRNDQSHQNTYLPVQYKNHLKSLNHLAERDALIHPTISKIWRTFATDGSHGECQRKILDSGTFSEITHENDTVDGITFESNFSNLVGSYYGLPTSEIVNTQPLEDLKPLDNSLDSMDSDLDDRRNTDCSDGFVLQPHRKKTDSFDTTKAKSQLSDELRINSSVLENASTCNFYETVFNFGYFDDCEYVYSTYIWDDTIAADDRTDSETLEIDEANPDKFHVAPEIVTESVVETVSSNRHDDQTTQVVDSVITPKSRIDSSYPPYSGEIDLYPQDSENECSPGTRIMAKYFDFTYLIGLWCDFSANVILGEGF